MHQKQVSSRFVSLTNQEARSQPTSLASPVKIDFEWLGNDKYSVQTNYYVNHQGGREKLIQLGFDCSKAFHKYTIKWSSSSIKWYVDDKLVRTATNDGSAYPTKPSYLYSSIWDASSVNGGAWAGTASYSDAPYYFKIKGASAS